MEKNSRKFRKSTCISVSPYIVIAMERDSHFHSSYIVLAVMNHLRMAYSIPKDICGAILYRGLEHLWIWVPIGILELILRLLRKELIW